MLYGDGVSRRCSEARACAGMDAGCGKRRSTAWSMASLSTSWGAQEGPGLYSNGVVSPCPEVLSLAHGPVAVHEVITQAAERPTTPDCETPSHEEISPSLI